MNQLKSRTVSSLPSSSDMSMHSHTHTHQVALHIQKVFPLHAKLPSNTLSAAHLTFISLIFDKCLSTAAAGART